MNCRPTSGCSGLRAVACYTTFTLCARPAAAEPRDVRRLELGGSSYGTHLML